MPAKKQVSKEEIVKAAQDILRKDGLEAINARNLAKALKCSTQPIYLSFKGMEELKTAVLYSANEVYLQYIQKEMEKSEYPPYKASGMAYIRFAKEEKNLFKVLFMRERTKLQMEDEKKYSNIWIQGISQKTGFDEETAYKLYMEMWFLGHGIAAMIVTSYFDPDWDVISQMLSDVYLGLVLKYSK